MKYLAFLPSLSTASLSEPLSSSALTGLVDLRCSTLFTARCSAV